MFGHVVGGLETLGSIEKIEVDNKDRPIEDIILIKAIVFTDPFQEVEEMVGNTVGDTSEDGQSDKLLNITCFFFQLIEKRAQELQRQAEENQKSKLSSELPLKAFKTGVGKYIKPDVNTQV